MSKLLRPAVRSGADLVLRSARAQRTGLRMAARRRRAIVLLWHRVAPAGPQPHEVVATVSLEDFHRQLDLVQELGDVVPLAACDDETDRPDGRPQFALTFDDDDARHAHHVLPVLVERGLPATFFLSGRWLHGHGPYWWELLEREIAADGTPAVAARYGQPADVSAPRLGQALTGTPAAQVLAAQARQAGEPPMTHGDAKALAVAGMEIGFHTIDHDVLPDLDDGDLEGAVVDGRDQLAGAVDAPVERLAYPHGRADGRTAAACRRAGYRSAWTTEKRTARPGDPPMLRGRWDVGHRPIDEIRRVLVRGLVRPTP